MIRARYIKTVVLPILSLIIGCGGSSNSTTTDAPSLSTTTSFEDLEDDERETVMIATADRSSGAFTINPAAFDTVIVRSVPAEENEARVVEALLKGSFPDGCTELHELEQTGSSDGQIATLTMRRPESAMCTQVVRPYRFFFRLDDRFSPGEYVLVMNDRSFEFKVE
jgi:hypothetical protein